MYMYVLFVLVLARVLVELYIVVLAKVLAFI